jgi:hypothetical protein
MIFSATGVTASFEQDVIRRVIITREENRILLFTSKDFEKAKY